VKLKSLLVLTLLVLGCCAAFGQSFSFGFLSSSGLNEYCNYESFTVGGRANFYLQGYDVLSVCPYSPVGAAGINGFAITVPIAAFAPVHGHAYVYADQLYDAYYGAYTGLQWSVLTKTAVNKVDKFGAYNWAGYVGFAGYEFLGNFGFLSNTIPGTAPTLKKSVISTHATRAMVKKMRNQQ
jgi:hypothetical protein